MAATSDPSNLPSALGAIPPPVTADREHLTNKRVRTASDVAGAFSVMFTADLERSRQRALCQSAVDGAAPYSDNRSRNQGTYGKSNFNPGLARRSCFKEESPYNEILEQMDVLCTLPTKYGDDDQKGVYEPILAEEFTAMLKRWPRFYNQWQMNVSLFVRDGVSVMCFSDEKDWRPEVYGLQYIKFPNETKPCEDMVDMCGWTQKMNCRDLYKKIQNKEIATKLGWNVGAVEDALKQATALTNTSYDYEKWQQLWKDNDMLTGTRAPQVWVVNLLVQEIDGTVTHLVGPRYPQNDDSPLFYEGRKAFSSMSRFMTLFTYGVGTNGDLHSIRGHASRIFNSVVADTRTINAFVDMAVFSATPQLECRDDDAMSSLPFRKVGYMNLVQNGNKFLDIKTPDFSQNLLPLHALMTQLYEGESSGGSMMPGAAQMERKTNQQEMNERLSEGQLTTSAMALFFPALERNLKEIARRVCRKDYRQDEPGGQEVWWLRNRLKSRGVPLDALYEADIDAIEVNTGIGRGSQSGRLAVANALMEDYYLYDDNGKTTALRLKVGTIAGSRIANQIVPPIPGQRPGQQVDNADDQNGFLTGGNRAQILSVKVRPDQNSAAHVRTHLEFLEQLWPMTTEQDQRAALTTIQPLWVHAIDDLQLVDPKNPLYADAKQRLREMGEWVTNTAKELAAEEDRQADEAARNGGQPGMGGANGKDVGGEGPNMSNFARAIDAKAKLEYTLEKNSEELRHRRDMNALEKAGAVQNMLLKNAEAQMKVADKANQPLKKSA